MTHNDTGHHLNDRTEAKGNRFMDNENLNQLVKPATANPKDTVAPAICGDCASFDTGDCASQEDDSHKSACASFIAKPATVEVATPKGGKKGKKATI